MTTLDKAIQTFGFENPITITIAVLEEQGKTKLAEQLYEECAKEVYDDDFETDCDYEDNNEYEDDWDDYDRDYEPDEIVVNPFAGCYYGWDC
jgi:hypothetical protein